jgi:NAD-dependent dihydropyrimidine dehydrogenase PreA subunit
LKNKVFSIQVDFEVCQGCGYCLEVCPNNVFDPGQDHNDKGYLPPIATRPEDCLGCRSCYMVCPDFCLEIESLERSWPPTGLP